MSRQVIFVWGNTLTAIRSAGGYARIGRRRLSAFWVFSGCFLVTFRGAGSGSSLGSSFRNFYICSRPRRRLELRVGRDAASFRLSRSVRRPFGGHRIYTGQWRVLVQGRFEIESKTPFASGADGARRRWTLARGTQSVPRRTACRRHRSRAAHGPSTDLRSRDAG